MVVANLSHDNIPESMSLNTSRTELPLSRKPIRNKVYIPEYVFKKSTVITCKLILKLSKTRSTQQGRGTGVKFSEHKIFSVTFLYETRNKFI